MKNVRGEMETEVETHMETEAHQARHVVEGLSLGRLRISGRQICCGKSGANIRGVEKYWTWQG